MDKKKHKKAVLYVNSLKERAEKLREEADYWKVNPNIYGTMKKIGFSLEFFRKKKLSEKEKKKLLRLTKRKLTSFKKHFSSVYRVMQENPMIWNKKIKETEEKLEQALSFYEKAVPFLFRKG